MGVAVIEKKAIHSFENEREAVADPFFSNDGIILSLVEFSFADIHFQLQRAQF
jgi:hypothetical protein